MALNFRLYIALLLLFAYIASMTAATSPIAANFSIEGGAQTVGVVIYNFDNGLQNWTPLQPEGFEWKICNMEDLGPGKGFSAIEPSDVSSLFVETPGFSFGKGKSHITSPSVSLPEAPSLEFYVGFAQDFDDVCRLILSVSDDDFLTSEEIWNSGKETGAKNWRWHKVSVPLSEYEKRDVKFRFLYTSGSSEKGDAGGYLGDFAVDGFRITALKTLDRIEVRSGELIQFEDYSEGEIEEWLWDMPGAFPDTSAERNPLVYYLEDGIYDVTLTVYDRKHKSATRCKKGFVSVVGDAPQAVIVPPAAFRIAGYRKPLIAPLTPVTFSAEASGAPTLYTWNFTGVSDNPFETFTVRNPEPTVQFRYLHDQKVSLVAQNQHGVCMDDLEITVEYEGFVTNLLPDDTPCVIDMHEDGVFPGSNNAGISAFAEKFSKPSTPVRISGVKTAVSEVRALDMIDRLTSIGVHLYSVRDGLPYKEVTACWKTVDELSEVFPETGDDGIFFAFDDTPFINDEFFIVVDGCPKFRQSESGGHSACVSFGMASPRQAFNTAFIRKDNEWIPVENYLSGENASTSFMIYPQITHSVMIPLSEESLELHLPGSEGTTDFQFFSYLGYENPECSDSWFRVISKPGNTTVQNLKISYDALPYGTFFREGILLITDGGSSLELKLIQEGRNTLLEEIFADGVKDSLQVSGFGDFLTIRGIDRFCPLEIFAISGEKILSIPHPHSVETLSHIKIPAGIYLLRNGERWLKIKL